MVSRRRGKAAAAAKVARGVKAAGGASLDDKLQEAINDSVAAFRNKVRIVAADGGAAERRAVFLAVQKSFPHADFVIRDAAHALRIAMYKPLQLESLYGEVYKELTSATPSSQKLAILQSGKQFWRESNVRRFVCQLYPTRLRCESFSGTSPLPNNVWTRAPICWRNVA